MAFIFSLLDALFLICLQLKGNSLASVLHFIIFLLCMFLFTLFIFFFLFFFLKI